MSLQAVEIPLLVLNMERILKSQVAKLLLLSLLLLLIPFISTSLRSSYLYFLLNLLIIVLGVEAGLLASVSKPRHDESKTTKPALGSSVAKEAARAAGCHGEDRIRSTQEVAAIAPPVEKKQLLLLQQEGKKKKKMMMEIAAESVQKLKRCRSRPSIFFIGSCDEDLAGEEQEQVLVEEKVAAAVAEESMSKQELFMKAEMFIGNFYQQLKMQREESWKKIHGLYHRAF